METLMNLYNSVSNPLDDIDVIKKCIELYSETQESGKSFYENLVTINSRGIQNKGTYNGFYEEILDNWRMKRFKYNIVNMTPEKYASLFGNEDGYYSEEFQILKKFLIKTDEMDLSEMGATRDIRNEIEKNDKLNEAFKKYGFNIIQNGWDYISSSAVLENKPIDAIHRLYINMDDIKKYQLMFKIIDGFIKEKVPVEFKYSSAGRDDTMVMWTDNDNLIKTIEILRKIKKENKDLFEDGIFQPPLLSGKIDNWIGYGSEPNILLENKKTSFNRLRSIIIKNAISNVYTNYSLLYSDKLTAFEIAKRDDGFTQAVRAEIIRIGRKCEIDENNFCFDSKTVQQMKQTDSKVKQHSQQQVLNTPAEEEYQDITSLVDGLVQRYTISWEDLLKKDDNEQMTSKKSSIEIEKTQDLESLLKELNSMKENDEKRKPQKQVGWRKKIDKRDKDYYKKVEAYLLGELKRLSPEERKRGNQYLSALEHERDRNK